MDIHEIVAKHRRGESLTSVPLADILDALCDAIDDFIEMLEQEAHMGAFDTVPNITIPDPNGGEASKAYREKHGQDATAEQEFRAQWNWEAHEQVLIKGVYTGVEQEQVDNSSAELTRDGKNKQKMSVRVGTARNKLLETMIVDWTLSQGGMKVPVSPGSIARLPANYRTPILEKIDEIARVMSQDEQEAFLPSANGHSSDNLQTTNSSPNPS